MWCPFLKPFIIFNTFQGKTQLYDVAKQKKEKTSEIRLLLTCPTSDLSSPIPILPTLHLSFPKMRSYFTHTFILLLILLSQSAKLLFPTPPPLIRNISPINFFRVRSHIALLSDIPLTRQHFLLVALTISYSVSARVSVPLYNSSSKNVLRWSQGLSASTLLTF